MTVSIAAALRSPFTRVEGALAGWHPVDLAAAIMNATLNRAELEPGAIDDVWVGCAEPVGAQGANMARAAVLAAGWPVGLHGQVVDRGETSGMAALHAAVAAIESGAVQTAMVLGVCSATAVQPGASALGRTYGRPWGDGPAARLEGEGGLLPAPAAADRAAQAAGIDRARQETWTRGSVERRALVPSTSVHRIEARPGDRVAIQRGTPIAYDDAAEIPDDADTMPPSFDPDGSVTGFTFSPPMDGVSCLILTADSHTSDASGPRIIGSARSAGEILDPLGGVATALAAALARADRSLADVARFELTEPTAAAALLAIERLGLPEDRVNPAGGTLGVGDAGAAEELRLIIDTPTDCGLSAALSFGPGGAAVTLIAGP